VAYEYLPAPVVSHLRNLEQERESQPVRQDEETATWHVFRYSDVARVLTDARHFGAARSAGSVLSASFHLQLPRMDPQRHIVVRKLWQKAITPRAVSQLQPYVERTVGELLDPLLPAGKLEVISDLARPLATSVLEESLGDPAIGRASRDVGPEYFAKLVADIPDRESRREPQENFTGKLLSVEYEGEHLTREEVAASCYYVMTAARRALSDMLGNTLLLLSLQPDLLERLRRMPAPIYSAVEEALRYLPPVWAARRTVIAPVVLGGQNLPQGAHVCAWIVSANHDDEQFDHPERFDIDRIPNRHLSIGDDGTFACLGSGLPRLVARLTLAAIARRISDFELASGDAVEVASYGQPEDYAGSVGAADPPELGERKPAVDSLPGCCSVTKLAVVFEARV